MTRASRETEKRVFEERDTFDTDYVSLLNVPLEVRKADHDYRFVRYKVGPERDSELEMAIRRAYEPVPLDRVPSKYRLNFIGGDEISSKYFCAKDTVLMERPNVFTKRDIARQNEMNHMKIKSLRGVSDGYENATTFYPLNGF